MQSSGIKELNIIEAFESNAQQLSELTKLLNKQMNLPAKDLKNVPIFSGKDNEDVDEWIFLIKNSFQNNQTANKDKVAICANFLRDLALSTYRGIMTTDPNKSWNDLKKRFLKRFRPSNFQNLLRIKLQKLKQTSSLSDYTHKFQVMMNQIENMSDLDKVHWYTEGLTSRIRKEVSYRIPKVIEEAIESLSKVAAQSAQRSFRLI